MRHSASPRAVHGSNVGICQRAAGGPLEVQSRNFPLSDEYDTDFGTYAFVHARREAFLRLLAELRARFGVSGDRSLYVFGELAGGDVQTDGIGTEGLPLFFVLFSVAVGGAEDMDLAACADVHVNDAGIYHAYQFGTYTETIVNANIAEAAPRWQAAADEVGRDCPVARFFGRPPGSPGEGIVWVCRDEKQSPGDGKQLIIKMKARSFAPNVDDLRAIQEAAAREPWTGERFAARTVTEERLRQGLAHLRESRKPLALTSTPDFVAWVVKDALEEEGGDILPEEVGDCKKVASRAAVEWYKKHLAETAAATAAVVARAAEQR